MKLFVVLICSLALACVAVAQPPPERKKEQPKKTSAQAGQVSQPRGQAVGKPTTTGKPTTMGKPAGVGKATGGPYSEQKKAGGNINKPTRTGQPTNVGKSAEVGKPTEVGKATGKGKVKQTEAGKPAEVGKAAGKGKPTGPGKPGEVATTTAGKTSVTGKTATGKPVQPQHFNLPKQPNTAKAPPVKFQQGKHIEGSQNWQGSSYTVFRNYTPQWHDQGWWHSHYNNIVFVFGAPYFFNAGYWFPAWGYQPNAYYASDAPIYAYNNLPPDQVIANVQAALQQQGYYHGEVDGLVGPETRGALAAYQRDHGLYETAAIDQPTLESMGMA